VKLSLRAVTPEQLAGLLATLLEVYMSRIFEGNVSVVLNTKDEVALKRDPNGAWNASNAKELYSKCLEISKAKKKPLHKWSFFKADGGTDVLLMADRYGNPRITILPPKAEGQAKSKVTKLA
jgi:hypothetical protein